MKPLLIFMVLVISYLIPSCSPQVQVVENTVEASTPTVALSPTETATPDVIMSPTVQTPTVTSKANSIKVEGVTLITSENNLGIIEENTQDFIDNVREASLAVTCDPEVLANYAKYVNIKYGEDIVFSNWIDVDNFMEEHNDYLWDTSILGGVRTAKSWWIGAHYAERSEEIMLPNPVDFSSTKILILDFYSWNSMRESGETGESLTNYLLSPYIGEKAYYEVRWGYVYMLNEESGYFEPTIILAENQEKGVLRVLSNDDRDLESIHATQLSENLSLIIYVVRALSGDPPVQYYRNFLGDIPGLNKQTKFMDQILVPTFKNNVEAEEPSDVPPLILEVS